MELAPSTTMTFTITAVPKNEAGVKTLRRLMRMQPEAQKALTALARRRRQFDNRPTNRAGRIWVDRKKPTQVVKVAIGESFTLRVTPQIIGDIKSVEKYIDGKAA
ncbi:MAG: hypothetical protein GY895_01005 [Phycisphaera sp.]|nr:hypothetical protein [Phycisphaera sp.]